MKRKRESKSWISFPAELDKLKIQKIGSTHQLLVFLLSSLTEAQCIVEYLSYLTQSQLGQNRRKVNNAKTQSNYFTVHIRKDGHIADIMNRVKDVTSLLVMLRWSICKHFYSQGLKIIWCFCHGIKWSINQKWEDTLSIFWKYCFAVLLNSLTLFTS